MNKKTAAKKSNRTRRAWRGGPAKRLGEGLVPVTKRLFRNRGLGDGGLVIHWRDVVGAELAAACAPYRISYAKSGDKAGVLKLTVEAGAAPLVQHNQEKIIDRTNAFFGYRAVGRLSLSQSSFKRGNQRQYPPVLPSETLRKPENQVTDGESVQNPSSGRDHLAQSLARLKSTLEGHSRKSKD